MSTFTSLLFILFATSVPSSLGYPHVRAGSKSTISILARTNAPGYTNLVEADQARARALRSASFPPASEAKNHRRASSFDVTNNGATYTAKVGIGLPPTDYNLLIDSGSSNTWIGSRKPYVKTNASKPTNQSVHANYASGSFFGSEFIDTVTLSPDLVIVGQSIGVASNSSGFDDFDGILGIGPVNLTQSTISAEMVPTVTDNLFTKGIISTESIGIFFTPVTANSSTGELTFGGVDETKIKSDVHFVPITKTPSASLFWGFDQSITYNSTTILNTTAGIVDTATTLIFLTPNAFNAYKQATGAVLDNATRLLSVTPAQFAALEPLDFHIGGQTFSLSPNAQIWPRSLNTAIGGDANAIYLVIADLGPPKKELDYSFIIGFTFLERFYTVFDTTHNQVGFAPTEFTNAELN